MFVVTVFTLLAVYFAYRLLRSFLYPKKLITDVSHKYVLITGCDSGFGRVTAVHLDGLGVHVIACCLTEKGAENLRNECSDRLRALLLDVTSSVNVQDVYETVKRIVPPNIGLWGLVNNAGTLDVGPIEWLPLSSYKHVADVNLWGMIDVTKAFLPLVQQAHGRVVNVSSITGRFCPKFLSAYVISKYGIEAFSDALRREMRPFGVKVSIVEPEGFKTNIATGFLDRVKQHWKNLSEELKAVYGERFLNRGEYKIYPNVHKQVCPDLSPVVNAITDGLLSFSPQTRYVVGGFGCHVILAVASLPGSIADWCFRLIFSRMNGAPPEPEICKQK
ncbi:predicted protein [Nematostella vectensis]|uniref:Uncharacterized protein n=1 Tax=Nematostella vectensis TaxID=45351 RepID=A7SRY0_NEMVE|nr:predicted protein [Nematostella vectensis]|eukprot:XP_001625660.1 predicted protein [Nematostella vectensis]